MAELRYVDWDGLVYYDGKVKQYIGDKLEDVVKMGGLVSIETLPSPSFQNLNYIYKITEEFTSNNYFEKPGYIYKAGTWVQVTDLQGVYLYTIFNEEDASAIDIKSLEDQLNVTSRKVESIDSKVTSLESQVAIVESSSKAHDENIEKLSNDVKLVSDEIALKANSEDIDNSFASVNEEIGRLSEQVTANGTSLNNALNTLLTVTKDVDALEDTVKEISTDVDKIPGLVTDVAALDESVDDLTSDVNTLKIDVANSINRIGTIEDSITDNATAIETLKENDDLQDEAIEAIDTRVKALEDGNIEVNLENYYTKDQVDAKIPSIEGLATEQYVQNQISEIDLSGKLDIATYEAEKASFLTEIPSNYVTEDELPKVPTKISELDNDTGYLAEIPDVYVTEDELNEKGYLTQIPETYALKSDIPDVSSFLTEIPSEYITETELEAKEYLTEHQSLDEYAKKTDLPSIEGLATEQYVNSKIESIEIPTVDLTPYAKLTDIPTVPTDISAFNNDAGYITAVPDTFATKEWVEGEGFLKEHQSLEGYAKTTDIPTKTSQLTNDSGFAKGEEVITYVDEHLTDKQDKLVSGTNIATINGKSLLDGGNIEIVCEGGNSISSPDDIFFTFTDPTTQAVGGITVGTTITNWSLTKLIQSMLFGITTDEPTYDSVTEEIIATEAKTYSQDANGNLVETPFVLKTMTAEEAALAANESCFYQITDENGEVIESGYQEATVYQEEDFLTVALPNSVTNFIIKMYNDDISDWQEVNWKLEPVEEAKQTIDDYIIYRVPDQYEVMSGITIRLVIIEE